MAAVKSMIYNERTLQLLDQLLIPSVVYVDIKTIQDGYDAIKTMKVRGAPAIAVAGALTLAVALNTKEFSSIQQLEYYICESLKTLVSARPTAVNIFRAADDINAFFLTIKQTDSDVTSLKEKIILFIEKMLEDDIKDNIAIGKNGAEHILKHSTEDKVSILTHCNAGALATAGYGTAVGVIRSLNENQKLNHAFCTETRPYNQGARLTAFELVEEGINATLITDSSVSITMNQKQVSAVVVGADRVALNGDTANKIGTYQIAITAKYHGIPFYIAAPFTTIDKNIACGNDIVIEERSVQEITHYKGERVTPDGIKCWNPAFDVTPASLITGGIITERGVFKPEQLKDQF